MASRCSMCVCHASFFMFPIFFFCCLLRSLFARHFLGVTTRLLLVVNVIETTERTISVRTRIEQRQDTSNHRNKLVRFHNPFVSHITMNIDIHWRTLEQLFRLNSFVW
jgi:hypothetical protein